MIRAAAPATLALLPAWLAVAIGGAAGSALRHLLGTWTRRPDAFPWTTLAVNVAGSFLLGLLVRAGAPTPAQLALTVGFCGGFTTFSTFGLETLALLERGDWARAGAYAAASVVLGVAAAALGVAAGRALRGP